MESSAIRAFKMSFLWYEKFWNIKGNHAVRHYLRQCRSCRFWKSKACKQLMAPLPKCRVSGNNNPFTCTGVDYFGLLLVKVGRSRVKQYGCLFTCMATRAGHPDFAGSLDASSFLQVFFRFIHRRGPVKEMCSDRGTNFVLAERELRNGIMRWNQQKIHDSLCQRGVQWHFIPPLSPSSGGPWEVLVKAEK